jgi:hypothetical protein
MWKRKKLLEMFGTWGKNLGSTTDCDFAFKPSEGRSGGLLTMGDSRIFSAQRKITKDGVLWVEGEWGEEKKFVNIVNVYISIMKCLCYTFLL